MLSTHRTRLRLCLAVTIVSVALTACGGAAARFQSHLQRGKDYLAAGNLDKASVEFRNAGQIQPKNPEALYYNGRVAEAHANMRQAIAYYQATVDADAGNLEARARLGKMLIFAGATKQALDTITPALTAHPNDPDLLAVRAAAENQQKDVEAATKDAERAVQLAPANENAIAVLAGIYAQSKDYPKAIALVSKAVGLAPKSIELREVLTNLYLSAAQPKEAEAQMRQIIELRPEDLAPRSQLALHLARGHDLDGAQKVLEEAVQALSKGKQVNESDAAKLLLVDFIANERSREQGEKTLREFIARDPENLDLRLGLGGLLQRSGAAEAAVAAYQEVIKQDNDGPKALIARDRIATIEMARGHAEAASKLIAEVLQKSPRDDDALILRSSIELQRNDPTGAIADLRAVLRDQPNSIPLQRSLARAYVAKGDGALAQETLQTAMQGAPNDVGIRADLTELYLQRKDLSAARQAAEELQQRHPDSATGFLYAGLVAAQENHAEESEKDLLHALELQPRSWEALSAFAQLESARGSYDTAITKVRAAAEQFTDDPRLLGLLGELYFQKKDYSAADDAFSRESAKYPAAWQPHRSLALVKLANHDAAGALSEYEAAVKLAPTEPRLVADAALFYEQQGHVEEAIQGYENLYKNNPATRQFAANNLAMLLVTYRTDRASLDRARDLTSGFGKSDNGSLLDTFGWVLFKRGQYQDALPPLQRAADAQPDARVVRFHLAMDQLQLGQRDQARANLESALAGAAQFSGADQARTVLASLRSTSG